VLEVVRLEHEHIFNTAIAGIFETNRKRVFNIKEEAECLMAKVRADFSKKLKALVDESEELESFFFSKFQKMSNVRRTVSAAVSITEIPTSNTVELLMGQNKQCQGDVAALNAKIHLQQKQINQLIKVVNHQTILLERIQNQDKAQTAPLMPALITEEPVVQLIAGDPIFTAEEQAKHDVKQAKHDVKQAKKAAFQ
jgi:hypothetical protein